MLVDATTTQGTLRVEVREFQGRYRVTVGGKTLDLDVLRTGPSDLSVLVEVSDDLAIMYAGKIVEEGPSEHVFHSPVHPYTKALAAAFPEIRDMRFRGRPSGLGGDPPDPQHVPSGCPFHPRCDRALPECAEHDIELRPAGDARHAACIHVPAEVAVEVGGPHE